MADQILQPTSNTTPDPGQGGAAVTGASNTGHSSTNAHKDIGGASVLKTCIWTTFQSPAIAPTRITLKFDWSNSGQVDVHSPGQAGTAEFIVSYSLNGGAGWTAQVTKTITRNTVGSTPFSDSASESVNIDPATDISQIQVRDSVAVSGTVNTTVDNNATVSSIQLEVEFGSNKIILAMM